MSESRILLALLTLAATGCDLFDGGDPEPMGELVVTPAEVTAWPDEEIRFEVTLPGEYENGCEVEATDGQLIAIRSGCRELDFRVSPFEGEYVLRVVGSESGAEAEVRVNVVGDPYPSHDPVLWRRGNHPSTPLTLQWRGEHLYTATHFDAVRVFHAASGDQVDSANPFVGFGRMSVDASERYVLTDAHVLREGLHSLHVYDRETRRIRRSLRPHGMAEWIGDTDELVQIVEAQTLTRWAPLREQEPIWQVDLGRFYPLDIAVSPDGRWLLANISGNPDRTVPRWHVYDLETGERVLEANHGPEPHREGAWSPDGLRFAAGGLRRVSIFDAQTGALEEHMLGDGTNWQAVAWSPDGRFIALGDTTQYAGMEVFPGGRILLWDVEAGSVVWLIEPFEQFTGHLEFSPDSSTLAAMGGDPRVLLFDVATGEQVGATRGPVEHVRTVRWNASGTLLLVGQAHAARDDVDLEIFVYDEDGAEVWSGVGRSPHWVDDGSIAFAHDELGMSHVDVDAGRVLEQLTLEHPSNTLPVILRRAIWHPSAGTVVASITRLPGLHVWDRATSTLTGSVTGDAPHRFEVSPDGVHLVVSGEDGVGILNASTLEIVRSHSYPGSREDVRFSVSHNARFVVTSSWQEPTRVFRLDDGSRVFQNMPDTAGGECAGISPDGQTVIRAGYGGFELWDARSNASRGSVLNNDTSNPECAAIDWHPTRPIVAVGGDNQVYVMQAEQAPPWEWWLP